MKRRKIVNSVIAILVVYVFVVATADIALAKKGKKPNKFLYAAKVVCGEDDPDFSEQVMPGAYSTSVNILNPNATAVTITKRLSLTFPPEEQEPGMVSGTMEDELEPYEALQVDGREIPAEFFPDIELPTYVEGVLIVECTQEVDVSAVYTVGARENDLVTVRSIDVEQIQGRQIASHGLRKKKK